MSAPKANTLLQKMGFSDPQLASEEHDEIMFWVDQHARQLIAHLYPCLKPDAGWKVETRWEVPITAPRSSYIVGFLDMYVRVISTDDDSFSCSVASDDVCTEDHSFAVGVEVKSHIKNAGELIRQLRTYQQSGFRDKIVVIAPECSFSDTLERQGFTYLPCPNFALERHRKSDDPLRGII